MRDIARVQLDQENPGYYKVWIKERVTKGNAHSDHEIALHGRLDNMNTALGRLAEYLKFEFNVDLSADEFNVVRHIHDHPRGMLLFK